MQTTEVLIIEDSRASRVFLSELVQLLGFFAHAVQKKTHCLTDLDAINPDLLSQGLSDLEGSSKFVAAK
jgi:CheY-like chemotaxis protein